MTETATKEKEQKKEEPKNNKDSQVKKESGGFGGREQTKNRRPDRRKRTEGRARTEFDQKIVSIRRVARVMAGGRRFSFSVCLISGDKRGKVGVGLGKATDTSLAIEKASRNAKKNMITVAYTNEKSIAHEAEAKYCGSKIIISPAPGKGVKAGGAVRTVLEMAGINDISAKILSRSKNHINNARATVNALKSLSLPKESEKKSKKK